jgi:alanyl-tRNA synthetase
VRVVVEKVRAEDVKELQAMGDILRENLKSGIGVMSAALADGKHVLLVVVTDDLRTRGVRADQVARELAAIAGGRGGGKPHMAQAGLPEPGRIDAMLAGADDILRTALAAAA